MITYPNCGKLKITEIKIYNENLRKQNLEIFPVFPTCKVCAAELNIKHKCSGGNIIVLNGTCGSGKSTIAEILAKKGFLAIDGDCVIQTVKHKKNISQVGFNNMAEEIAYEIDILSLIGKNFVLAGIITPEDIEKYKKIFTSRALNHKFFLLKPKYETTLNRCQTRTCHTSITPEYWIKHFYELLNFGEEVMVVDNTNMTADKTAEHIYRLCHFECYQCHSEHSEESF